MAHGCNTQKQMGAGVALQVRLQFPYAYELYLKDLTNRDKMHLHTVGDLCYATADGQPGVYNLYTQMFPGKWARAQYVESSFKLMLEDATKRGITEIAIPYLIGCGYGGLKESVVMPIITEVMDSFTNIKLIICELKKPY